MPIAGTMWCVEGHVRSPGNPLRRRIDDQRPNLGHSFLPSSGLGGASIAACNAIPYLSATIVELPRIAALRAL